MKIVLALVDGMRPDSIAACGHPYLDGLTRSSLCAMDARTVFPSVTLPCHMSLFHSVDPTRHGVLTNTYTPQVRPVDGLFDVLHSAGRSTASFYNWEPLRDLSRPGSLTRACYWGLSAGGADRRVTRLALDYITQDQPDFTFLYLGAADEAGHKHGWMTRAYLDAVAEASACIQQVAENLPDDDVLIVTADPGGHDRMHGENIPEDMTIPLLLTGGGIRPGTLSGARILDLAPTVAGLLGVAPSADWEGDCLL